MKRNFILTSLLIFSLTSLSFAQDLIKISGGQTAGTGVLSDAKIGSEPVNLPSQGEISKVEGRSA